MKRIRMELEQTYAVVEERYRIDIAGYTSREEARRAIEDMLRRDGKKVLNIDFCWHSNDLCVVNFRYEKIG